MISKRSRCRPSAPKIIFRADALHEVVSEAEDALIDAGAAVFQRGQMLVIPISVEVPAADNRRTKSPALKPVDVAALRDRLSRYIVFKKYNKQQKSLVAISPPVEVAEILLSRAGEWRLRSIAGIITTPTMRADGSILTEPGYDPATQLFTSPMKIWRSRCRSARRGWRRCVAATRSRNCRPGFRLSAGPTAAWR